MEQESRDLSAGESSNWSLGRACPHCFINYVFRVYRIHQAIKNNVAIVDVDGSHLHKKCMRLEAPGLMLAPMDPPPAPLCGWETVIEANASTMAQKLPCVTEGKVYNYILRESYRL